MCSTVQCFNLGVYYMACSYYVENMDNFTYNFYYVACPCCVENMDNFTLKCVIKNRIEMLHTR